MNWKLYGIAVTVVLLATAAAGVGFYVGNNGGPVQPSEPEATPTPQPVEEGEVPQAVKDSRPGAEALYQRLQDEDYNDLRVFITQRGEVAVVYKSSATHGPELKNEMKEIALAYSEVMGEHPETGGLTVQANGVEMLASSDTALAHANGKINEEAYFKTLHFGTMESHDDGSN